jgi:hypothetical protein
MLSASPSSSSKYWNCRDIICGDNIRKLLPHQAEAFLFYHGLSQIFTDFDLYGNLR